MTTEAVKKPGRFEKSFGYLAWHHSAGCVLDVFHENVRLRESNPSAPKACADSWCVFEDLRRQIHERARVFWCRRTGLGATYFPLSVDAVARLYFRIRKRRTHEIAAFNREIEAAATGDREAGPLSPGLFDDDDPLPEDA